jgi:hypothetical protein
LPAAGEPAAPMKVRDCSRPVPLHRAGGTTIVSTVSVTVTVQVTLNTQLMPAR